MAAPTDPSDWHFKPLKELDALLRCSICFEYYQTPIVMPNCSHIYCSLCIRRYLSRSGKKQCPTCSAVASDSSLRGNRILDEIVKSFTTYREAYMRLVSMVTNRNGRNQHRNEAMQEILLEQSHYLVEQSHDLVEQSHDPNCVPTAPTLSQLDDVNFSEENENLTSAVVHGLRTEPGNSHFNEEVDLPNLSKPYQRTESSGMKDRIVSKHRHRTISESNHVEKEVAPPRKVSSKHSAADKSRHRIVSPLATPEATKLSGSNPRSDGRHLSFSFEENAANSRLEHCNTSFKSLSSQNPSPWLETSTHRHSPSLKLSASLSSPSTQSRVPSASSSHPPATVARTPSPPATVARTPSRPASNAAMTPSSLYSGSSAIKSETTPTGQTLKSVTTPITTPTTPSARVECPVCGLEVFSKVINQHLDFCLNKTSLSSSSATASNSKPAVQLPRLPKLCPDIMKDKQLRMKLKEYHLPWSGSRQAMMSRLKEFMLQYNAQCDSLNPKTVKEIAEYVENVEIVRGMQAIWRLSERVATPLPGAPVKRSSISETELEEQRKSYEKQHKSHYAELIAQAKERQKHKPCSEDPNTAPLEPEVTIIKAGLDATSVSGNSMLGSRKGKPPSLPSIEEPPALTGKGKSPTVSGKRGSRGKPPTVAGRGKSPMLEADISNQIDALFGDNSEILAEDSQEDDVIVTMAHERHTANHTTAAGPGTTSVPNSPSVVTRSTKKKRRNVERLKSSHTPSPYHRRGDSEDADFEITLNSSYPARKKQRRC